MSMEGWREAPERREDLFAWLWPKIDRALAVANAEAPAWGDFDIGHAGLLQGVSYLDAWAEGHDDIPGNIAAAWRERWPSLARWFARAIERESVTWHYRVDFEGDWSPERHARAVAEALEAK